MESGVNYGNGNFKVECITEWNYVRLLWIGYYKNDENDECFVKKLPKDVLLYVINKMIKIIDW